MVSLKYLKKAKAYIISNSKEEDQTILEFFESYGYRPIYTQNWYENFRNKCSKVCFIITESHFIDIKKAVDTDVYYHIDEIKEYACYTECKAKPSSDNISIDDEEFNILYKADFNYKENKMKLLEIYKDRKMDEIFKDADKACSKAWEKNSNYK